MTCFIVRTPTFTLYKDCRVFSFEYSESQLNVISTLFVGFCASFKESVNGLVVSECNCNLEYTTTDGCHTKPSAFIYCLCSYVSSFIDGLENSCRSI